MEFVHDIPTPDSMDTYLGINVDLVTLEDCEDLYRFKNKNVIINDGHIVNWVVESWVY